MFSSELSPVPMCSRLFPTFSSIRFSVSGFMFRFLINLDLSFVQGDKYGDICILLHADLQLDQYRFFKVLSFSHCMVLDFLSKIKCPWICGFIPGSSNLFHCSDFLFLYQYHVVFITIVL